MISTYVAGAVSVVIGALHTSSDLVAPSGFALKFRDQVGVGVLQSVWDWSITKDPSPSGHQSLGTGGVFLAGDSDWLNL